MGDQTRSKIENELRIAYQAQKDGKDGLARVCARRAAGWAIQQALAAQDIDLNSPSALDHIKYLHQLGTAPAQIQQVLTHLQVKVEKDSLEQDAYWPLSDVDLVKEAHWLVEQLLKTHIPVE